MGDLIL